MGNSSKKFLIFACAPTGSLQTSDYRCLYEELGKKHRTKFTRSDMHHVGIDACVERDAEYIKTVGKIQTKYVLKDSDWEHFSAGYKKNTSLSKYIAAFETAYHKTLEARDARESVRLNTTRALERKTQVVVVSMSGAKEIQRLMEDTPEYVKLAKTLGYSIGIFFPSVSFPRVIQRSRRRFQFPLQGDGPPRYAEYQDYKSTTRLVLQLQSEKWVDFSLKVDGVTENTSTCTGVTWWEKQ